MLHTPNGIKLSEQESGSSPGHFQVSGLRDIIRLLRHKFSGLLTFRQLVYPASENLFHKHSILFIEPNIGIPNLANITKRRMEALRIASKNTAATIIEILFSVKVSWIWVYFQN